MNDNDEPVYPTAPKPTTFREGVEFQDFVCVELAKDCIILQNMQSKRYQLAIGENLQGFEIKLDNRCLGTGQLSIEIAEKSNAANSAWVASGIYRPDSWLYIQGNYEKFWIFSTAQLRRYHQQLKPREDESHGTVRKFYIKLAAADLIAAKIVAPSVGSKSGTGSSAA